jgi:hypothetical protein
MEFLRYKAANAFDVGIRRDAGESPLSPSQKPVGHKYTLNALPRQTFDGHSDKKPGTLPGLRIIQLPAPPPAGKGSLPG